jgi:hypothetical protein
MKLSLAAALFFVIAPLLSSCGKIENHSVEYYKEHVVEREAMLERCKADPDRSSKVSDCTSAGDAEFLSGPSAKPSKPRAW